MRDGYRKLREEFVENLRKDLIGPYEENEVLYESPTSSYIMGRLSPITENVIIDEVDDSFFEENQEEDDDNEFESIELSEELYPSKNKQSSAGLKVFLPKETDVILAKIRWADYIVQETNGEESNSRKYKRVPKEFVRIINITNGNIEGELLEKDVYISWITHRLHNNNKMISIYVENRRRQEEINDPTKHVYQIELILESTDNTEVFLSESSAYSKTEEEDYFYNKKPIFSRGYGCAAVWEDVIGHTAKRILTSFVPSKEINGVDAEISKFSGYFSMLKYSESDNKEEIIRELLDLLGDYKIWIERLKSHEYMKDPAYKDIGDNKIKICEENLSRMSEGVNILQTNDKAFYAFIYMNKSLHLSRSMGEYSKSTEENKNFNYYKYNHSFWRPFQIGFVLLNIQGIVYPETPDRNILDLLYFPTGGGKTEAYLGVIAFLLFHRRITKENSAEFEKDGGVTVIVRYTLRLLTTQQRDRMLRLISACEMLRNENTMSFGDKEFSIGFWVGSTVTVNKYADLVESKFNQSYKIENKIKNLKGQILKCPCCGSKLDNASYKLDIINKKFEVFCSNNDCYFNNTHIPVYLIDEDIYKKTPTVIIGTVDKFARITFEEKTNLLFGKRKMECPDCGSMLDAESIKSCTDKGHKIGDKQKQAQPFYPPELILQDELHLITGPLGTIYGSYEMAIDELSKVYENKKVILPKYIASTATIKNADKQITSLYARSMFNQFPSNGHDSDDSYFSLEKSISEHPFREYIGISSPYTSMKTTISRVYAVLLQTAERYKNDPTYKDFIDPFWTLVGYYNSKRELGGAVRLIQDDIPARALILKQRNGDKWARNSLVYDEITSRKNSREIPKVLERLETSFNGDGYPYDVVVATNMIQVGMDVERLGLMAVTGQPKTTAEYIQATSRIGRKTPGLVVTIYNAYRSRDLSHYENFTTYHSHLYRYVEGNSATPFSARSRERSLHAALIAILRGRFDELRDNKIGARAIERLSQEDINEVLRIVKDRVTIVDHNNWEKTLEDIRYFYDEWINLARKHKNLYYHVSSFNRGYKMKTVHRLLKVFGENGVNHEKSTLNSMRNVQKEVGLYLWEE
ncbi:DISARM system helicase DrmA [Paenibacillus sp. PvR133]|uniref:DISARM system helicase DrmA n=2 Tax=Paenibacillus TaxID=44249 RepID=UPI001AE18F6B|nr:DISARM system helicase DrmA [Paenibacillus sp. PvR133]MBP1172893.1 hypothetical protein [Paenibacillus sp. PvR133]